MHSYSMSENINDLDIDHNPRILNTILKESGRYQKKSINKRTWIRVIKERTGISLDRVSRRKKDQIETTQKDVACSEKGIHIEHKG